MQRCQRQPNTLAMAVVQAGVGVGDDQLDPVQPAGAQRPQEAPPEALGLGLADVETDDLPAAGRMDAVGDHQRLVADPTRLPDPLHLGVQPQVRIGAGQGPLPEDGDLLVQAAAEPADGVLAHPLQPQLLDQPVDLAGRDPVDIGLLDHRDQGLLGPPARLQERREVADPVRSLGMASSSSPDPGVPAALAGSRCAGPGGGSGARSPSSAPVSAPTSASINWVTSQATLSRSTSACSSAMQLVDQVGSGHPVALGHRGVSFVDPWTDRRS